MEQTEFLTNRKEVRDEIRRRNDFGIFYYYSVRKLMINV
jgi:hypothetical protein